MKLPLDQKKVEPVLIWSCDEGPNLLLKLLHILPRCIGQKYIFNLYLSFASKDWPINYSLARSSSCGAFCLSC
jgi:hypothetical protein